MQKQILLPIKAKHVNEAKGFADTERCPVARAANEFFNTSMACEGVVQLFIGADMYAHDQYGITEFRKDRIKAIGQPDETVIRTLLLTKEEKEEDEKVSGI